MLSSTDDSVQLDDWIVMPNLPEDGSFLVGQVTGDYYYEPLKLNRDADISGLDQDYGHVLPVQVLTVSGINRYADEVAADLRGSLRTPMRMWSLDAYGDNLEQLVERSRRGADLSGSTSGQARLEKAWKLGRAHAVSSLRERLDSELDARFQAAEWEEPIKTALEHLYPGASVRWVAGPNERGADVVLQIRNAFGGGPWLIVVQVKDHVGEIGTSVLAQLRTAHEHYSKEGSVLALVVMTTAPGMGRDLLNESQALSAELRVPVHVVLRHEMMAMLAEGLMVGLARSGRSEDTEA